MTRRRLPDAVVVVANGIGNQALTLISGPLVARLLGPSGRGEIVTVLAVSLVTSQFVLASLTGSISRAVAASHAPARDAVGPFLGRWMRWVALASVASGAGTAIMLRHSPSVLPLALLAVVLTFVGGLTGLLRAMVYGEHGTRRAVAADLIFAAGYVLVVVILFVALRHASGAVVLMGYFFAQLIGLTAMYRALLPATGAVGVLASRQEIARFARASYFSGLGALDRLGFDSILIGQMLGAAALGLYSVASSIGTLPAAIVGTLATPLLPKMVAATPRVGAALMRRWMLVVMVVFVFMVPVMWVLTGPVVRIFFGTDFEGAILAARLLLLANAAFGLRLLLGAAALAQDRERSASLIAVLATPAMLISLAIGAKADGLAGAALGMVIVSFATCGALACVVSWTGSGVVRRHQAGADPVTSSS